MLGRPRLALLACVGAALAAVPAQPGTLVSDACGPSVATLAQDATLVGAHGRYRLVFGTRASDRKASGVLVLAISPPGRKVLAGASTPLQGSTDIDVSEVGALRIGDPASTEPDAPGVLVLEFERDNAREIMLRLGSDANRVDRRLFDGGYTVLRVRQIDADGFSGTWESGVRSAVAQGYFCARRL